MKLFVYGTLKRGYGNNIFLRNAKYEGNLIVKGYKLYNAGFPVAKPCADSSISGEVYTIDPDIHLPPIDRLEGNGRMYHRTEVPEGVSLYVGGEMWNERNLDECPKDQNNVYSWSR